MGIYGSLYWTHLYELSDCKLVINKDVYLLQWSKWEEVHSWEAEREVIELQIQAFQCTA